MLFIPLFAAEHTALLLLSLGLLSLTEDFWLLRAVTMCACRVPHLLLPRDGGLPLLQRGEQLGDLQLQGLLCGRLAATAHLLLDGGYLGLRGRKWLLKIRLFTVTALMCRCLAGMW